jgi:cell division protein FtsN
MSEEEDKKSEKYNTVFLVSQIQSERSRNMKIGLAVAAVIVLAIIYFLFIKEPAPSELPAHGATPTAPAAPTSAPGTAAVPAQPATPTPSPAPAPTPH